MNKYVVPFMNSEDGSEKSLEYMHILTYDIEEVWRKTNALSKEGYYVSSYNVTRYYGRFVFSVCMERIIGEDPSITKWLPTLKF